MGEMMTTDFARIAAQLVGFGLVALLLWLFLRKFQK